MGLTEERAAQIVKQSGNARNIAFLAFLLLAVFIPVYWFYALGVPALGISGRAVFQLIRAGAALRTKSRST